MVSKECTHLKYALFFTSLVNGIFSTGLLDSQSNLQREDRKKISIDLCGQNSLVSHAGGFWGTWVGDRPPFTKDHKLLKGSLSQQISLK